MPILFVHTATAPPLGADTWVHAQIMGTLDRRTHDVRVACATGPSDQPTPTFQVLRDIPDLELRPVRFGAERIDDTAVGAIMWLLGALHAFTGLIGLVGYVRRQRIAIIHTSDRPRDALLCVLLARLTRTKCIIQVHVGYGDWMSPLLKWALKRADALIAVSSFVATTLNDAGYGLGRTHVVLNGIDASLWEPGAGRAAVRQEFGVADDALVVLTVCRLFPEKGPALLIEAMAAITVDHPDALLLIVGQEMAPGFAAELSDLAERVGLNDNVVFTGRRNDVSRLMAGADVYAMPSLEEPFGLVYLEAMAMELPVVALASGGALEIIEDHVTGLLSAPGDLAGLTANLATLAADPTMRARMGRRGRRRVVDNFTIARMARDVASVYREVVGETLARTERKWKSDDVAVSR